MQPASTSTAQPDPSVTFDLRQVTQKRRAAGRLSSYFEVVAAYVWAAQKGQSDAQIAQAAGVSVRTVAQFRRLAMMPQDAVDLAQAYPELFTATWAIKLARKGPVSEIKDLTREMQLMVTAGRTWLPGARQKPKPPNRAHSAIATAWCKRLNSPEAGKLGPFIRKFVLELYAAKFISKGQWAAIEAAMWPHAERRQAPRRKDQPSPL